MMNEQEQVELAAENDGYTNEWQRAAAVSHIRGCDDDRSLAVKLVAEGYHVVVELTPWHCSITDAVIGEWVHVWFYDRSLVVCQEKGLPTEAQHDPDGLVQIWPLVKNVTPAAAPVEDDGIPF
jgi:hypothetical protein